ncbi:MAG: hypothetical protein ACREX0_18490 [Noviherbaspirillum sp.]
MTTSLRRCNAVVSPWRLAGGGPAAGYFLCLAKESNQRKATAAPLPPSGVPKKGNTKAGSAETRLRLKHLRFFFRFGVSFFGSVTAELQNLQRDCSDD